MENTVASSFPRLTLLVALPALDALLLVVIPGLRKTAGKGFALAVSLLELVNIIGMALSFDWTQSSPYQLLEPHPWTVQMGATQSPGVNTLGLMMILLTVTLILLVLLAGRNEDENEAEAGAYAAPVLFLEMFMIVISVAFDFVVFYIAFEVMLIPLFFMIGRYGVGGARARRAAAVKFLLYSPVGGLAILGGIIVLWTFVPQHPVTLFRFDQLVAASSMPPTTVQMSAFISFIIASVIKAPMVPLHTWLPDTVAVSRPGTSVLLVDVLDKISAFGMIVLCLCLFPEAADQVKWVPCVLAVLLIIWGGLAANGQDDIMRLVPHTSASYFGFMVLGIFIGPEVAFVGAMFHMVTHGVPIAAMLLLSGWLVHREGAQDVREYGGVRHVIPYLASLWFISGLASIALPGLSGFVPEYLVLMEIWKVNIVLACFTVLGVIIVTVYVLMPHQRTFTGEFVKDKDALPDLDLCEKSAMTPLIVMVLVLGMYSTPLAGALTLTALNSALGGAPGTVARTLLEGSSK